MELKLNSFTTKILIILSYLIFLSGCDKLDFMSSEKHYNCLGTIENGLIKNIFTRQPTEIIKNNITITFKERDVILKGDGSQFEFISKLKNCSDKKDSEINFYRTCETLNQQLERLQNLYKEDTKKIEEQKNYDDNHFVRGTFNKINNTLSLYRNDNSCYDIEKQKKNKTEFCGIYSESILKCEEVKIH